MKRFYTLVVFLLPLTFTAQSSDVDSIIGATAKVFSNDAVVNNIVIKAGQSEEYNTSARLTLSGSDPVTVNQYGSIKLVAGKSILLLPGTRISSGGFMYASITPGGKSGKHAKKVACLVTIEENERIEEQACLSMAATLLSPFPSSRKGHLNPAESGNATINPYSCKASGLLLDQQRKHEFIQSNRLLADLTSVHANFQKLTYYTDHKPDCRFVLRL